MSRRISTLICSVFGVCISLICLGCGDDGPAPQGSLPPKVGSAWTFNRWFLDSNKQTGEQETLTATVRDTDAEYEGESGLFHIEEALNGDDPNDVWLRYEENGDVRLLHPSFYPVFITLPTGSRADSTPLPVYDTSYTESGIYFALHSAGTMRYLGEETLDAGKESVAAHHLLLDAKTTATVGSNTSNQTFRVDLWYAPSLGYFARTETWVEEPPLFGLSLNRGDRRLLREWSLKP